MSSKRQPVKIEVLLNRSLQGESTLRRIKNWSKRKRYRVGISGIHSEWAKVISGIPQISVLEHCFSIERKKLFLIVPLLLHRCFSIEKSMEESLRPSHAQTKNLILEPSTIYLLTCRIPGICELIPV